MMIKCENGSFPSSLNGETIVYTRWFDSETAPKALLLIAHGMAEYAGRYDDFARFMVQAGFAVYGNDHLGHGKSGSPDKRGWFGPVDGRFNVIDDMLKLCRLAKKDFPGVKVILLGHSMGSFISRIFCTRNSNEIDGAIFMGTGSGNPLSPFGVWLAGAIAAFKGEMYRSRFYASIVQSQTNCIKNPRTPCDWLNTDEAEVDKYIQDKDCGFLFTLSGYRELMKMMIECNEPSWAGKIRGDLPVLLTSGAEDPIGGFGGGVRKVHQALLSGGVKNAEIRLYENMRHEILNEKNKKDVYRDILDWCQKIV